MQVSLRIFSIRLLWIFRWIQYFLCYAHGLWQIYQSLSVKLLSIKATAIDKRFPPHLCTRRYASLRYIHRYVSHLK